MWIGCTHLTVTWRVLKIHHPSKYNLAWQMPVICSDIFVIILLAKSYSNCDKSIASNFTSSYNPNSTYNMARHSFTCRMFRRIYNQCNYTNHGSQIVWWQNNVIQKQMPANNVKNHKKKLNWLIRTVAFILKRLEPSVF